MNSCNDLIIIGIASALGPGILDRCLNSLFDTLPSDCPADIIIRRETSPGREQTLNALLNMSPPDRDIFLVGDDIIFTLGWHEALLQSRNEADIIGFSTLFPGTDIIQQTGYDLVESQGRTFMEPCLRGEHVSNIFPDNIRMCDSICGCTFFISANARNAVGHFDEAGLSRWGNILYCLDARRKGLRIGVISHTLFHEARSTKASHDLKHSSMSYLVERDLWDRLSADRVDESWIKRHYQTTFSDDISPLLNRGKTLLFGAGTISEMLVKKFPDCSFTIASGLKEEEGCSFFNLGYNVHGITDILKKETFDQIIITVLNSSEKIAARYFQDIPDNLPIYSVKVEKSPDLQHIHLKKMHHQNH